MLQWDNKTTVLFEGDFTNNATYGKNFTFESNLYHSAAVDLRTAEAFGGCSYRKCQAHAFAYTWAQWQALGQDTAGRIADSVAGEESAIFADPDWYKGGMPFNLSFARGSPAPAMGIREIDTSRVGVIQQQF